MRRARPRAAQANEVHNEVVAIGLGWNDMTQTSEQTLDTPPPGAGGAAGAGPRSSAAADQGGEGESTDLFATERRRRAAEAAASADTRYGRAQPRETRASEMVFSRAKRSAPRAPTAPAAWVTMPGFVTPVVEGRAGTVENAEEQELAQAAAENRRAHEAAAGGSTAPPASAASINPLQDDGRSSGAAAR